MDIFKCFLQFSEKSIPVYTLNDRYTTYSFFISDQIVLYDSAGVIF